MHSVIYIADNCVAFVDNVTDNCVVLVDNMEGKERACSSAW